MGTENRSRDMKGSIGFATVLLFLGTFAYLDVSGRTDSWPEAPCKITSSRDVPQIFYGRLEIVRWKGEYQLQYEVNGQEHSIWADAVDWNEDRIFVESSMSDHHQRSYTVRFNPANASEAIARMNAN